MGVLLHELGVLLAGEKSLDLTRVAEVDVEEPAGSVRVAVHRFRFGRETGFASTIVPVTGQ